MFRRQFRTKSSTVVKQSVKKQIRAELKRQYSHLTDGQLSLLIPPKEETTVARLECHGGDVVDVYSVAGQPIIFTHNEKLLPTVYAQWVVPDFVPVVHTHEAVLERIKGGADLMLPGVSLADVEHNWSMSAGDTCAVALAGYRGAAAIGLAAVDATKALAQGMKGKGVVVVHTYQDELWAKGTRQTLPIISDVNEANAATANVTQDTEERLVESETSRDGRGEEMPGADDSLLVPADGLALNAASAANQKEPQLLTGESEVSAMDRLLLHSTYTALSCSVQDKSLPLLASALYAQHILPCRPQGTNIDIKQSSYKKLSKLLRDLQDQGLVQIKEVSKGVDAITAINRSHPNLRGLKLDRSVSSTSTSQKNNQLLAVEQLYKPTKAVQFLLPANQIGAELYNFSELRQVLDNYIAKNDIADKTNKRNVIMDPHLSSVLLQRHERALTMPRDNLAMRLAEKCQSFYRLSPPGKEQQVRKGPLPRVHVLCEQRMGRKVVTLVRGLPFLGIDVNDFAKHMQTAAASSTAVHPSSIGNQSNDLEVLIQGHAIGQVEAVLLSRYNVPKKLIDAVDKSGRSKAKK